ncbi:thioredoxin family protein [Paenibacillus chibensis]|uniref:Thioredoxin family protein n=1 Tax=Paenibacillus chibensis TaxID=59846 RepID=A0ABU6PT96_9BACL|nr:thioredoxin family protein [Paenibacillus chibensis]MEC0371513.1 thioredoxin family protein [Paenibacillus chibensis]MED5018121.1 thioredoxin family protein [Paenibacillus chibensis]
MRQLDEKQLLEELWSKGKPLAVFMHTPFCGTCKVARRMLEVTEHMLPEGIIAEADVNMLPKVVEQYKIRSVPALLITDAQRSRKPEVVYSMGSVADLLAQIRGVL